MLQKVRTGSVAPQLQPTHFHNVAPSSQPEPFPGAPSLGNAPFAALEGYFSHTCLSPLGSVEARSISVLKFMQFLEGKTYWVFT